MKFFTTLALVSLFILLFVPTIFAQSSYKAVLLLTTENKQTLVGNQVYYDLVLNTLGNGVNEIDVQFLLRGSFDRQSMTFNLHPQHSSLIQSSQPLEIVSYDRYYENEDGVRIRVVLKSAGGKPFNEGSAAIPVYRVGFKTNGPGEVHGYIDSSHSYVRYAALNMNDYDNYSPESRPTVMTVIGSAAPSVVVTIPTRVVTSLPMPTSMAEPSDAADERYDQEFKKISNELAALKTQAEQQEQRLSLLEQLMQSLRSFWMSFFR